VFDVDKAALKPAAQAALRKLALVLRSYPNAAVAVGGHTSSEGDPGHNQKLSERRAAAGFGAPQPVADNKAREHAGAERALESGCH
jgi:flagellar motor protein MotB